ncbi:MAG: hypothetical protein WC460_00840 [Patescibacteria group bacterium]
MQNKYGKFIGIIISILAILTVLFFLFQDLAWTGRLELRTDFKKFTPFISILKPQDQVEIKDVVKIKKEPVWFDVYMPRDFDRVRLGFTYKNDYNYKIEVGPRIYEENNPLQILDDGLKPGHGFITKSLEFDLRNLPISQGKLRFMISVPGLIDEEKGVSIKELKVELIRQPIWEGNLEENLIKYFNYYENKFR